MFLNDERSLLQAVAEAPRSGPFGSAERGPVPRVAQTAGAAG